MLISIIRYSAPQIYLLVKLLMSFIATFFVEKKKFPLVFSQIWNLGRGYIGLLFYDKTENILYLCIFEDIFTKNEYLKRN